MNLRPCALAIALLAAAGCDRRVEPFVPGETPQSPDLTKIFPAGAERAAESSERLALADGRGAAPIQERAAPISGTIELAPELAGTVPPNGVLYLMARRPGGGPPLAVQRIDAPSFPLAFSIGAEDRMMADVPFSGPLIISVRLDSDGDATTRDVGDLLGSSAQPHESGDRGVVVSISEVQGVASQADMSPAAANASTTALAGRAAPAPGSGLGTTAASGTSAHAIEGTLELAPDLAGRVPPGAVLFVIARTAQSGPPLAVVRVAEPRFPQPFSIGPEHRMIQSVPFAGEILLSARVDADGDAMTRGAGDLSGSSATPSAPGDRGVTLLIDQVL